MANYQEKLKALKENGEFTLDYLSKKTGVNDTNISKYINGSRKLLDTDAHALCKFFKVDVDDYLFNDDVDVLANPEEVYPYKTREEKDKEKKDIMDNLKSKLDLFTNCDKDFKKDVEDLILKQENVYKKMLDFFASNKKVINERGLLHEGFFALNTNYFYYIQDKGKMLRELKKIENFILHKDGVGLYNASKAIFEIKKNLEEQELFFNRTLEFVDEINNTTSKYEKIENDFDELNDEVYNVYSKLHGLVNEDNLRFIYPVLAEAPEWEFSTLYAFWLVTKCNSYFEFISKAFNVPKIKQDTLINVLLDLAYDGSKIYNDETFKLGVNEDTVEKIYRYSVNFIFEDFSIDDELEIYKVKAINWIGKAKEELLKFGIS